MTSKLKDDKNVILADYDCLVKYDLSTREYLWVCVCVVSTQTGLGQCHIQGMLVGLKQSPWSDSPFARAHSAQPRAATLYSLRLRSTLRFRGGINDLLWSFPTIFHEDQPGNTPPLNAFAE